jgi:retinol dehydrogenase-14
MPARIDPATKRKRDGTGMNGMGMTETFDGKPGDARRMDGRVCVVTGATAGIGQAAATELARRGATVVLLARDAEKARITRDAILRAAGHERVETVIGDLSIQAQVRAGAAEVRNRHGIVHVLINNAAAYSRARRETADGIELQLAVNHLAPFLLTRLLLEPLRAAAPGRVVSLSSGGHRGAALRWDDLEMRGRYSGLRQYANTKLYNLWMVRELARRVPLPALAANAMHPGVVGTALLFGGFAPLRLLRPWLRTPEEGARTAVHLACAPEGARVSGGYFKDEHPVPSSPASHDAEAARRMWEISERMTGLA